MKTIDMIKQTLFEKEYIYILEFFVLNRHLLKIRMQHCIRLLHIMISLGVIMIYVYQFSQPDLTFSNIRLLRLEIQTFNERSSEAVMQVSWSLGSNTTAFTHF